MTTREKAGRKRGSAERRKELKMLKAHENNRCPLCGNATVEYVTERTVREETYCCCSCDASWVVTFQAVGLEVTEDGRYEALVAAGGKE